MSDGSFDLKDIEKRMNGALNKLKHDFSGLRTGRASATMLDPIMVEAYGNPMPISQVATVSVPEPRTISVNVWDQSQVQAVEKAIRDSNLGLSPNIDGGTIRINIPELNEERRLELTKVAAKYAESSRVSIRNVRRDGMDTLKKMEKDSDIGQDEQHDQGQKVQDLTDKLIAEIDATLVTKEAEIMQV